MCLKASSFITRLQKTQQMYKKNNYVPQQGSALEHLRNAIEDENLFNVKRCMDQGVPLNTQHTSGGEEWTPLCAAVRTKNIAITKLLCEHGANVNQLSGDTTPLSIAIENGDLAMVKLLCERRADVNKSNTQGWSPIAKYLHELGGDVDHVNDQGDTPIMIALRRYFFNVAWVLCELGANLNIADHVGNHPLHLIPGGGEAYLYVRLFCKHGANVNAPNSDGVIPLVLFIRSMDYDSIKVLCDHGADVNLAFARNNSPLVEALSRESTKYPDHHRVVQLLCDKGANPNGDDLDDTTPLVAAAEWSDSKTVQILLDKQADVNKFGKFRRTVLMGAARSGNSEVIRQCHARGADVNQVDAFGDTALGMACEDGNLDCVRLLSELGADVNSHLIGCAVFENAPDTIRLLHDLGSDLNFKDPKNPNARTPLQNAVGFKHNESVKVLCELGADINTGDMPHLVPIQLAIDTFNWDAVSILVGYGATISPDLVSRISLRPRTRLANAIRRGLEYQCAFERRKTIAKEEFENQINANSLGSIVSEYLDMSDAASLVDVP